ncbi:MAG: choice-of-anchor J domain-containing protein, partial [Acidobacteriota bacterium]
CSDDKSRGNSGYNVPVLDELYASVQTVELNMAKGYLFRATEKEIKTSFKQVLQDIKVASLRLKKNPMDSQALLQLSVASKEYDKLRVLEVDESQLEALTTKLKETLETIATLQNKTLDNLDRVLFSKTFDFDLKPLIAITAKNRAGWVTGYHKDVHFARVPKDNASASNVAGKNLDSWLITPRFNLAKVVEPSFQVEQAISSKGEAYDQSVSFLVSTNYVGGDPEAAHWDKINPGRLPTGSGFSTVATENIDLKAYEGQQVAIAFRYNTTVSGDTTITWQLNKFSLLGAGSLEQTDLEGLAVTEVANGGGSSACAEYDQPAFVMTKDSKADFNSLFPTN